MRRKILSIAFLLILSVGLLLFIGCNTKTDRKFPIERNDLINLISSDPLYEKISEDFKISINDYGNGKIIVDINLIDQNIQNKINEGSFTLRTVRAMPDVYMLSVIDENINDYQSVEIIIHDLDGKTDSIIRQKSDVDAMKESYDVFSKEAIEKGYDQMKAESK